MRNIWKVKPNGKKDLKYIFRNCNSGDIILLAPGAYHFPDGFIIRNPHKHSVTIKGIGENPNDVIINSSISIGSGVNISFSNLTINSLHEKNGLYVKEQSTVNLNRVFVNGEFSGKYPSIYCRNSTLNMEASEVYIAEDKIDSVHLTELSEANIKSSKLSSLHSAKSKVQLHDNQIIVACTIKEDSVVHSTGVLDLPTSNSKYYSILVNSGARATIETIHANHAPVISKVEQASLTIKEAIIDPNLSVEIRYKSRAKIDVPENVALINLDTKERKRANKPQNMNQSVPNNQLKTQPPKKKGNKKKVSQTPNNQEPKKQQTGLEELNSLFGLHNLKKQINEFINIVKFNQLQKEQGRNPIPITLHSLFLGNPGTGKTTVARILGRTLYETGVIPTDTFVEVTRKDLVSEYIGETAKKTQEVLDRSKGGILFIDEAYSLYSESEKDHGKEAVDTILTFMEDNRYNTMIIFAGYTDEMNQFLKMNSGLESRIPNKFYFDDYSPEEIAQIGYTNLKKQGYKLNEKKYKDIVMWLYSHSIDKSNARWVRNINEKLLKAHATRVIETQSKDTITIPDEVIDSLTGNEKLNKEEKMKELLNQLDNLIGLDNVKEYVHRLMQQAKVDKMLMDEGNVTNKPSYHMIFAGNPGTGKTTVANIIAELFYYLNILPTPNVKVVDRSDLVGPYIGHTEKKTKEVLEQAMGGVLFIDEAYQLSSESENDFGKQAIETLITYLENHRDKFVVILAGYTDEMEEFLNVNPGLRSRIPNQIIFPDYTPEEVATIVEKMITKDWKVNVPLLKSTVIDIYSSLPSYEQANARWARNFSEKLIQLHKSWVAENSSIVEDIKKIDDVVILDIERDYLDSANV